MTKKDIHMIAEKLARIERLLERVAIALEVGLVGKEEKLVGEWTCQTCGCTSAEVDDIDYWVHETLCLKCGLEEERREKGSSHEMEDLWQRTDEDISKTNTHIQPEQH